MSDLGAWLSAAGFREPRTVDAGARSPLVVAEAP